jgi:hypothetical protein
MKVLVARYVAKFFIHEKGIYEMSMELKKCMNTGTWRLTMVWYLSSSRDYKQNGRDHWPSCKGFSFGQALAQILSQWISCDGPNHQATLLHCWNVEYWKREVIILVLMADAAAFWLPATVRPIMPAHTLAGVAFFCVPSCCYLIWRSLLEWRFKYQINKWIKHWGCQWVCL